MALYRVLQEDSTGAFVLQLDVPATSATPLVVAAGETFIVKNNTQVPARTLRVDGKLLIENGVFYTV